MPLSAALPATLVAAAEVTVDCEEDFARNKAELERMNRLYNALSQINQSIVHLRTRQELFDKICEIAVELGGFSLAFVGWVDSQSQRVVPVAKYGSHTAYLDSAEMYADERPQGRGPAGLSIRSGKPYICNDYVNDPATQLWRSPAAKAGFRSSGTFPIRLADKVVGALILYAGEPGYFQDHEIQLLEEAASDISFALDNFAREEKRLKAEEDAQRLAAIVTSTDDAIASEDIDGTIRTWNTSAEQMYGYSAAEAIGKNFSILVPPDKIHEAEEFLGKVQNGLSVVGHETERLHKNGTRVPVAVTISPVRDAEGRVVGASKIARNISERNAVLRSLRASEQALREAQHMAMLGSYNFDYTAGCWSASDEFYEITGLSRDCDHTVSPWNFLVEKNLLDAAEKEFWETARSTGGQWEKQVRFTRVSDGASRWATYCGRADFDAQETPLYVTSTIQDITEQKLAEAERERALERTRILFEQASDGMCLFDENRAVISANQTFATMLGRPIEEVIGLHPWDWDTRHSTPEEHLREYTGSPAAPLTFEAQIRRADGSPLDVEISLTPSTMEGQQFVFQVVRDITVRKQTETALAQESARNRLLFEQATDPMFLLDDHIAVVDANASFAHLLGRPLEEVRGLHVWDWDADFPSQDAVFSNFPVQSSEPKNFEARLRSLDGSIHNLEVSVTPTEWNGQSLYFNVLRDITDRKQAEASLREAEDRLRQVVDNLDEGLLIGTIEGSLVSWNPVFRRLFGFPDEGFDHYDLSMCANYITVYDTDGTVLPPERWPIARILRGERIRDLEYRSTSIFSPEEKFLSYSGSIVEITGGKKLAFLRCQDVTARRLAEKALRQTQSMLETVVKNLDEGLLIADANANLLLSNPAAFSLSGITGMVTGNRRIPTYGQFLEIRSLEGKLLPFEEWPMARILRGETVRNLEALVGPRGSKQLRVLSYSGSMAQYEGGSLAFLRYQDVTERKHSEQALRESKARYELVADSLNEGLLIADMDGNLLDWNPAAAQIIGFTAGQKNMHASDFMRLIEICTLDGKPLPQEEWPMFRVMRGETISDLELRVRHFPSSREYIFSYSGALVPDEGGRKLVFVKFHDVTARRRAEASLRDTQEQLLQSQKMEAIGMLAGGVAHDFNNALGVILGYGELLESRLTTDETGLKYVHQILKAQERASGLTRQLLAFSRKQRQLQENVNLNLVVQGMQEMLRRLIGADVVLNLDCDPALAGVLADRGQLEQVIMNMAVNARDAMPHGGSLRIRTANTVIGDKLIAAHPGMKPGPAVRLEFSDTGCGIDKSTIARIFEPFFTTKAPGHGTGLGLSIIYGIVEQSGGCIDVESEPGRGTTFILYFPAIETAAVKKVSSTRSKTDTSGTETVLVVDDEEAIRTLQCGALRAKGYSVLDAPNGVSAMEIVHRDNPPIDLLVSDIIMPGLTGPEVVTQLLVTHPNLRVIFMSGYTDDLLTRFGNFGPDTVLLQKPFSPETLLATVRQVLDAPAQANSNKKESM
ncbi:MAG: PAS domain S-box protein [Terracidiphilus sp.]|nr:PAS domain S-box protein [Terracidiphilus sp.]MDR3776324.1 PAS domain S-box protein [Terracidiphilus sp.]